LNDLAPRRAEDEQPGEGRCKKRMGTVLQRFPGGMLVVVIAMAIGGAVLLIFRKKN